MKTWWSEWASRPVRFIPG